jgi:F-type H+-transporting ATPase subunit a
VLGQAIALPRSDIPFPPEVDDFYLPSIVPWGGDNIWITKVTVLVFLAVGLLIIYFLWAYRDPKLVPTKRQWIAESIYGFGRNNIAVELIGHEGVRFAPYFTTLFCFILLTNLFGIIPGIQLPPTSHIAFPTVLAIISWVMFIWVGVRKHGFGGYFKHALLPPAPWFILPILVPIEFASTFIFRPFTLALRLFANMFAGHVILLVFSLGGFVMLNANALLFPISLLSWVMAVALTFLEALVIVLQAYVFVVLTASYVQGALAEEH